MNLLIRMCELPVLNTKSLNRTVSSYFEVRDAGSHEKNTSFSN